MRWTVEEATATKVRLRLDGTVLLATNADTAKAERGYDAKLLGYLEYDPAKKVVTGLEILALGNHWGESELTQGAHDGRQPLGIVFLELEPWRQAGRQGAAAGGAQGLRRYLGK